MLHNEKFCIPLRCPTVLVHPKAQEKKSTAQEKKSTAKGEEQQRGKAAERSSNKWGRAAEWGSAVAARDNIEQRVF